MTNSVDGSVLNVDVEEESNIGTINAALISKLSQSMSLKEFDNKLSNCVPYEDRISLIRQFYEWIPIRREVLTKFEKSSETSRLFRERGNERFKGKKYQDALKYYNLAVMFASSEDEDLALAYANRSAALISLDDPQGSLCDIEMAINCNYPQTLMKKLSERRMKCEELLKKQGLADEASLAAIADQTMRRKFCDGILFQVKKPNPLMPSAEEFVQVKYDAVKGRSLVVNRDIPAGTVLLVEKPYVSVLKNAVLWDTRHCHHCLKRVHRGIPCKTCVLVMYCSEECLSEALKEYHKYECKCMSYLHLNSSPRYILLVFRILCKIGPSELWRLFSSKDPQYFETAASEPFGAQPTRYESDSYLPIFHLVSHSHHLDPGTLYANALQALILTSILEVEAKYFEDIPHECLSDFNKFVATLALRHIESIPCNAISLDEVKGMEGLRLADFYRKKISTDKLAEMVRHIGYPQFAAGVYSACSLMNHSCDPNVERENDLTGGTLAIVATRNLKEGEALTTCYGRIFLNDPLDVRQAYLLENYYFTCDCVACRCDWPLLDDLMALSPVFCCPKCSPKFPHEDKGSEEFKKCILTPPWLCRLCGSRYSEAQLREQLEVSMKTSLEAYVLVLRNRPYEAIRKLTGPMKHLQFHLRPPFGKLYWNQESFKQALSLMVYFSRQ